MRIFGFLQVRNEVKTGHLERFLNLNGDLWDTLFAIDDASTDSTVELLELYGAKVVRNFDSEFSNESQNKDRLLRELSVSAGDGDAILWLDADEVLFCSRAELESLISKAFESGYDSISLNHLNLWRSESHFRIDDQYFGLQPVRIWRFSPNLTFDKNHGLHGQTHPIGLISTYHSLDYPVVHYGFSSLDAILNKYAQYFLHWQEGYPLDRLISEDTLELRELSSYSGKLGSKFSSKDAAQAPEPIPPYQWRLLAREARANALSAVERKISIICLIFQSQDWLAFAYGEALALAREFRRGEIEILFVANNPTNEVSEFLEKNRIPHVHGKGRTNPQEWYINSVYRSYNEGVQAAQAPWVYLINSDMAFSRGALRAAFRVRSEKCLVTTRLVERGILPTGPLVIERDFGQNPKTFRRTEFEKFALGIIQDSLQDGGMFMPLLASRDLLLANNGFPEGNIVETKLSDYLTSGKASISLATESNCPGDKAFFNRLALQGVEHKTALASIAYHFQEGELRTPVGGRQASGLAIMNDLIVGINSEEVLWGRLIKHFRLDLRNQVFFTGLQRGLLKSISSPFKLWIKSYRATRAVKPRLILSNATYQLPHRFGLRNAVLVQDRPKKFMYRLLQRASVAVSDHIFSNDLAYISENKRKNPIWIEIDTSCTGRDSEDEVVPKIDQNASGPSYSSRRGVFVGAFNSTKGFDLLVSTVMKYPEIDWVLISKISHDSAGTLEQLPNVEIHRAIPAEKVRAILETCDFLISTSPWETQHLASLEAINAGIPVYITNTGLLGIGARGLYPFGMVSEPSEFISNFSAFINHLDDFDVVKWRESHPHSGEADFYFQLDELLQKTFLPSAMTSKLKIFFSRIESYVRYVTRLILRRYIIPLLLKAKRKIVRK